MAFSNGQLVQAADLNNFSVTTVTTSGAVVVGTTLDVTSTSTFTGSVTLTGGVAGTLTPLALVDISGASAGQVKFPATQNPSTNANTLDDYEEGTWTPVIGGSGGTSGQTYTFQVGSYVKIGKLVFAQFDVSASNKGTITTNAQIQGLPFASENTTNQNVSGTIGQFSTGAGGTPLLECTLLLAPNVTAADLLGAGAAVNTLVNLTTANFDTAIRFAGVIVYRAAA